MAAIGAGLAATIFWIRYGEISTVAVRPIFGLGLLLAGLVVPIRKRASGQTARALLRSRSLSLLGAASTAAWLMPVAGLWIIARHLGGSISAPEAARVFSLGTLLGGVALLPLGAGVTGSSMILQLQSIGVSQEASIVAVALLRGWARPGTRWRWGSSRCFAGAARSSPSRASGGSSGTSTSWPPSTEIRFPRTCGSASWVARSPRHSSGSGTAG